MSWYWWPLIGYILLAVISPPSDGDDNPSDFT
jgi:hypothetical protein